MGIDDAFAILIDDIHVREEVLYDWLQAGVFNLQNGGVLEKGKSTACLEDLLGDVDNALDRDLFIGEGLERDDLVMIQVSIDHSVNDSVRLDEKVDVLGRVDIPQEVLVDCDQELNILVMVNSTPKWTQLLVHILQVALVLQLYNEKFRMSNQIYQGSRSLTSYWMIKLANGWLCWESK